MNNLGGSGVTLKKLDLTDWQQFIQDINANFATLLSSPLFKGSPGNDGNNGLPGAVGERGTKWFYISAFFEAFVAAYGDLNDKSIIGIGWLNEQLQLNKTKLILTLNTEKLIAQDIVVLQNGTILSYDAVSNSFKTTNTNFTQNASLTIQQVQNIVTAALEGFNVGAKLFRLYGAFGKNFVDGGSGGQNTSTNANSIIDIGTSDAGPGVNLQTASRFVSYEELLLANDENLNTLLGDPKKYHSLIQRTQGNLQEGTTNDNIPKIDEEAALTVLQNNYKNGIIIGYRNAPTFRDYARIFKNNLSELIIRSNYSMTVADYGEIVIKKESIRLNAPLVEIKDQLKTSGVADFLNNIIARGNLRLINLPNTKILSTDANGNITGSALGIETGAAVTDNNATLPSSHTVYTELQILKGLIESLTSLVNSITGNPEDPVDLSGINNSIVALNNQVNAINSVGVKFRGDGMDNYVHGLYRTNTDHNGSSLPNGEFAFLFNLISPSDITKGVQLHFSSERLYIRQTSLPGSPSFSATPWVKIADNSDITSLGNRVTALETAFTDLTVTILGKIVVDNDWIKKINGANNTFTLTHENKTFNTTSHVVTSMSDRIPQLLSDITVDKNHVTGKKIVNSSILRPLVCQPGMMMMLNVGAMDWSTAYNTYFYANGRGKVVGDADLTHWAICDGRNGTYNMSGVSPIGAGSRIVGLGGSGDFSVGSIYGKYTVSLTSSQNGPHSHSYGPTSSYGVITGTARDDSRSGDEGCDGIHRNGNPTMRYTTMDSGSGEAHENLHPSIGVIFIAYVGL